MCRLKGKNAIVTGAAQGLGEALASRLAAEGCAGVAIVDVNMDKALETAGAIASKYSCKTIAIKCDVTNEAEVDEMVAKTRKAFGSVDIVVSNAGILTAMDITEFPAEKWLKVMSVNLYGYFLVARAAARVMVEQKSGAIIQVNSKSGKKGSFRNSAYAASKFGGIGLTQSIALDMAPHGVRVNAVCPGNLLDGTLWKSSLYDQYAKNQGLSPEQIRQKYESQVPLGRGCKYDDVANVVVFLASDESSYMTGQAINVTGGQEMR